jgi:hypothetical protein
MGDRSLLVRLRLEGAVGSDGVAEGHDATQVAAPCALVGFHHGHALPDAVTLRLGEVGRRAPMPMPISPLSII